MSRGLRGFLLIPLGVFYVWQCSKNKRLVFSQLVVFVVPVVVATFLWYNVVMSRELLYLFSHNDFYDYNFPDHIPTYAFVSDFLVNYGLGLGFCVTVGVSLVATLLFWKRLPKKMVLFDVMFLVTLCFVVGLVLYLAVNLNLKAPYTSAVKYLYHTLPLFSLAAASLVAKTVLLLKSAKQTITPRRILMILAGLSGIALLTIVLCTNSYTAQQLTTTSYVIFRVQPNLDVGYSFYVLNPPTADNPVLKLQFAGLMIILSGLAWNSKYTITKQTKQLYNWIKQTKINSSTHSDTQNKN